MTQLDGGWLSSCRVGAMTSKLAAIDCGTNSTRLLVREGPTVLTRQMTITQLGQGVDDSRSLAPAAIKRTLNCLADYRAVLDQYGVERLRVTATSAARDASNREEFFDEAEAIVGQRPELLAGLEEGKLSFAGATAELDPNDGPFLVVDIGGGSTEFAYGSNECEAALSVDMGCVRFTEQYIKTDPPAAEELLACLSVTEAHLDDVSRLMPQARQARTFVGLAGTVSAAAAIEVGLGTYDREIIHHFKLSKAATEDVFRTLVTESREDRRHNPGLEEGRVDVIVGGMCILVKVMRYFGFAECLVSESDILDGLILSMFQ